MVGWGICLPHPISIEHNNQTITFRTAEAYFHWLRLPDGHIGRDEIQKATSPMQAKFISKRYTSDYIVVPTSERDIENMYTVVSTKLDQHKYLEEELISLPNDCEIYEDCTYRQKGNGLFWGAALKDGVWVGDNVLGKIWMLLKEQRQK